MENRYQDFLKNTLRPGLWALQQDPTLKEVNGLPLATFNIFIRAFRSGLSNEFKITLPHDLKNLEYLKKLLDTIEILISPGIPEGATLANAYTLPWLMENFENAQKVGQEHKKWQENFDAQVAKHNHDLLFNTREELKKALPSLADNEEKIDIIARDVVETVQLQALPAVKPGETQSIIQPVIEKTIRRYSAGVEELESTPQRATEIAGLIAQESEAATKEIVNTRLQVPFSPLFNIQLSLEETIVANLPASVYRQNPQIVKEIATQTMGRLSLPGLTKQFTAEGQIREATLAEYQTALTAEISKIINSPTIQESLRQTGTILAPPQQEEMVAGIVSQIGPTAMAWSGSVEATQIGTTMGGGAQAAAATLPFIAVPTAARGIPQIRETPKNVKELLVEGWSASHPTDFIFFGFSRPSLTTIPTSILGLAMDVIGIVPPAHQAMLMGYLGMDNQKLGGYINYYSNMAQAQKGREAASYQSMADFLSGVRTFKEKAPGILQPFITLGGIYGKFQQVNFRFSQYTGIGLIQFLDLVGKYGGPGAAFGIETAVKVTASRIVGASLHAALPKLFLYDDLAMEVYFKYGPKGIVKAIKSSLFEKGLGGVAKEKLLEKLAKTGLGKALIALAEKLGLSALLAGLSGGVSLVLQAAWEIIKKSWKYIAGAIGLLLAWLFYSFDLLHVLTSLAGGLAAGGILGGIFGFWGWLFGFLGGTALTAMALQFFKGLLSSIGQGLASGLSGFFSSLAGLPSLASAATPVFGFTGLAIGIPTIISVMVISEAFVQQGGEIGGVGSKYIQISKGYSVGAYQNSATLPNSVAQNGETITYRIEVKLDKLLTGMTVNDKLTVSNASGTKTFDHVWTPSSDPGLAKTASSSSWIKTYTFPLNPSFVDSLFTNTVTVNTAEGETQTGTLSFAIGNPPVDTPLGWPTAKGCLTQGPNGADSHVGYEAMDINHSLLGTPVMATHNGTVTRVVFNFSPGIGYGKHVIVTGTGPNGPFESLYAHLQTISVSLGDKITRGQQIGTIGATGKTIPLNAPHLHYEFRNLKMAPPYIPTDKNSQGRDIRGCVSKEVCNLCW